MLGDAADRRVQRFDSSTEVQEIRRIGTRRHLTNDLNLSRSGGFVVPQNSVTNGNPTSK
jgi:hypothetical protein